MLLAKEMLVINKLLNPNLSLNVPEIVPYFGFITKPEYKGLALDLCPG
jgi:hypothetical protein